MKRATLFCLISLFAFNFISLAKNKIEWFPGSINLNSGELLQGNINYNPELDIVSYQQEGNIKSYSAAKVKSFEIFDLEIEENRKYISVDFFNSSTYKTKIFFEVLLPGEVAILRRYKTFNQFYTLNAELLKENFGSYAYYALFEGKFINLKSFKKNLLPLFKEQFGFEIADFIERNKLKLNQLEHQVVIIDYYNYLENPKRKVIDSGYLISLN